MQLARVDNGTHALMLVPETLAKVNTFPKNTKWVVVFGVGRGGKSTLCNIISKTNTFPVSSKSEACTHGIWISEPILYDSEKEEYLIVVDSEGTEMFDTKHQNKILALTCLLASNGGVLIHNEKHYANTAISALASVAASMKLLKGLEKEQFPTLGFLVRNFEVEVEVNGVEATLEEFFRHLLTKTGDSYDSARQLIKESFVRRKMFTTPPMKKKIQEHLKTNFELPEGPLKADFDKLIGWIREVVKVKRVGGCVCDGPMLKSFLEECVKSVNEGDYVAIPSVLETTMDVVCLKRADDAFKVYTDGMVPSKANENLATLAESTLAEAHENNRQSAIRAYSESTKGFYQVSAEKHLLVLDQRMSRDFSETQVLHSKLKTERIIKEEQTKREAAERQAQVEKELREQAELKAAKPPGCEHEFTVATVNVTDTSHSGKWGGFLHGHRCCDRCRGNLTGRCEGACKGVCGRPRQIAKTEHFCKKCGTKPAA